MRGPRVPCIKTWNSKGDDLTSEKIREIVSYHVPPAGTVMKTEKGRKQRKTEEKTKVSHRHGKIHSRGLPLTKRVLPKTDTI